MKNIVLYYPEGHEAHFESDHPERAERVEVIRNALMERGIWTDASLITPIAHPEEYIQLVHSSSYLNVLEMTCKRGGHLDSDTYTTPASWFLAQQAAGGASAIASTVWERKAKRGFALTRPPGHHAMRGQGMGFCLINNIAVAAEYLIRKFDIDRLAIIDLDLHHGNGTQDIFWRRKDVFYISTHQSPYYPGTGGIEDIGAGDGEGWTANIPLPAGSGDVAFTTVMDELILPLLDQKSPQMILVSYGFDTHWLDPLGQLLLTANGYWRLVNKLSKWADIHCGGRIALILEGGYDLNAAKSCSLAVIAAMLDEEFDDPYPCPYKETSAWQFVLKQARSIWNL